MSPDDLLHTALFEKALTLAKFERAWLAAVGGEFKDELVVEQVALAEPYQGWTAVVLEGGLVATTDERGRWQGWKTREYIETREYYNRWAEFCRAGWTRAVPTEPGVYPTRDQEGNRGVDRTLIRKDSRLIDITRGFVGTGVTTWAGDWWRQPYPPLKDAV